MNNRKSVALIMCLGAFALAIVLIYLSGNEAGHKESVLALSGALAATGSFVSGAYFVLATVFRRRKKKSRFLPVRNSTWMDTRYPS